MRALIIGASGATGKDLVQVMLNNPDYTEVIAFVRRPAELKHPKLKQVITDFDRLEDVSSEIKGDVWFSCLGTTLKAAGSKDKQWLIDYEIPMAFAHIAKRNGVPKAILLSAYGASPKSNVFYSKMKGELEEGISKMGFDQYVIFRPGLLLRKDTDRFAEKMSAGVLKFLNGIGLIKRFKPLPTELLAKKLAKAPEKLALGKHIIELEQIFEF
ncbi:MAG: NAD(P)H-binding protein [Bacteroidia bacterium]|nr:NAD(P)H-binding protein [Bacteroidia bacterium]